MLLLLSHVHISFHAEVSSLHAFIILWSAFNIMCCNWNITCGRFNIICSRHIIILSYSHIICGKFVIICFTFLNMMTASVRYHASYNDVLYSVVFVTRTWFCANNIICCTSIFIKMIKIHCFPFRLNEFLTKIRMILIYWPKQIQRCRIRRDHYVSRHYFLCRVFEIVVIIFLTQK